MIEKEKCSKTEENNEKREWKGRRETASKTNPFVFCIRKDPPGTTDNFNKDPFPSIAWRRRRDEVVNRVWGEGCATLPNSRTVFTAL